GWVFVSFALLFFNSKVSAQCVLACKDNVQVSATPDNFLNNGGLPDPCTINLNLDMILEGTNTVFGPGSGCNAAYGRIEVRRGNTLIHSSGNLTTEDQTTSFYGTLYLGQSLTTKVLVYNQAGSVLNSCWGSITLEDKARPEIDCNVSVPVNSVSGVLGTG